MKTSIKILPLFLMAILLSACQKKEIKYNDIIINHENYKPGDTDKAYSETFNYQFRQSVETFESKFKTNVNKLDLLKSCSKYSFNKFTDQEVDNFRKQIDIFTGHISRPTFFGWEIKFRCIKGRPLFGHGENENDFFRPTPIKTTTSTPREEEDLQLYTDPTLPAELVVLRYIENQEKEPRLLEVQAKLRNMSSAHFDQYLPENIVAFHEDLIKIIKNGSTEFNELVLNKLINHHFSTNYKLIKMDWGNTRSIFSRINYIRVLFGSDIEIIDYEVTIDKFNFHLDTYLVNDEKERLLELLLRKDTLTKDENVEISSKFSTATASYFHLLGTSRLTLFNRNKSGRIMNFMKSQCNGDYSLYLSSGAEIFNLKDHSRCHSKVIDFNEKFQLAPFTSDSLLDKEGLSFDTKWPEEAQVVVAQMGAGLEYNHPKLNWRLLTSGGQLVSYNQLFPDEIPFESPLYNQLGLDFSLGSAMASLAAYGSQRIKIIPVSIDPFNPDFEEAFSFLETHKVQLAMVSPSVFESFNSKKAFDSLNSAIQKHPGIFVVIDAGNQGLNLNQLGQNLSCIQSSRSIVVTSSLPNSLILNSNSNFGNKCVELALDGAHFSTNRAFTRRINERFNSTDPNKVASAFAAGKVANYIAKNILLGNTEVESAKAFVLKKTRHSTPLKPYVQEGRVLPVSEFP